MLYPQRTKNSLRFKTQQGVVIIVALFIVALVASLSYMMMVRLDRDTHRTTLLWNNSEALSYAEGAIAWAKDTLQNSGNQKESPPLLMPIEMPSKTINDYVIKAKIEDTQDKYNLNNVTNPSAQADFKRLIQAIDPKISEQATVEITLALTDWLSEMESENSYSHYYAALPISYRAAHRAFITTSELLLVKGMTAPLFAALEPYIVALPAKTAINIQSAPVSVLMTLSDRMTLEGAKKIVEMRNATPITSTDLFIKTELANHYQILTNKITVQSNYFLVKTIVSLRDQQVIIHTLLERTVSDDKVNISVIWQSHNGY